MCTVIRNEFRLCNFGLNFHHPEYFGTSQWRWPRPVYLIYRLVMAGYTLFALIYALARVEAGSSEPSTEPVFNVMAYLTNWSYLVLTFHFFIAFVVAVVCYIHEKSTKTYPVAKSAPSKQASVTAVDKRNNGMESHVKSTVEADIETNRGLTKSESKPPDASETQDSKLTPWYSKISWILANITSDTAIIVTSIYFGALYKPSSGITLSNLNVHGLNSVFIIIDNVVSARPVRILHVFHTWIYAAVYIIFSLIYWATDRAVIYKYVLDWSTPGSTVGIMLGVVVLAFILQVGYFGLYQLTLFIYSKIYDKDN
ncbi:protein rolling stone-like [Haliotis rufescens]|uniref:protein rolling stone-like n=1 Tax=Haliotis rufescens TaxID=6454 RepID=UPI00201ECA1E|nr:protein rolling stone-like [Haliotis rufescens]